MKGGDSGEENIPTAAPAHCFRQHVRAPALYLVEVDVLHPHVLHHGRLFVDVRSDDAEG